MSAQGRSLQKIERRGGARTNAGRKAGGQNTKTRLLAEEAKAEGTTPIQVMLKNMRFYDDRAEAFSTQLEELAASMTPEELKLGGEKLLETLKLVAKVGDFRMKAQECAVDAAPYVHPRLASIEFKPEHDRPESIIGKLTSPKDAAAAYGALLDITPGKQKTSA